MTEKPSDNDELNDGENNLQTIRITLSRAELVAIQEKAKGIPVDDFIKTIAISAAKTQSRDTQNKDTSHVKRRSEKSFTVIGPFGARTMTSSALREETYQHNLRVTVLDEILNSADRSTAIVGGAFVEDGLARLIKSCWRDDVNTERNGAVDEILSSESPLGTFSAKNKVAYMCRIIGPLVFSDLELIRKIRNKFAHWMTMDKATNRVDAVAFDHSDIRKYCDSLRYSVKSTMEFSNGTLLAPNTPRNKFILTVLELGDQLHSCAKLVSTRALTLDALGSYLG